MLKTIDLPYPINSLEPYYIQFIEKNIVMQYYTRYKIYNYIQEKI